MSQLNLRFFGQFQVTQNERPVTAFESDKVRALLAFLAVEGERVHTRNALTALLWPDYDETSARTSLRQALYQLRQVLNDAERVPPALLITRQTLQFNLATAYTLDVTSFATHLQGCADHVRMPNPSCATCLDNLRQAVDLYQGEFLAGFTIDDSTPFEEWRRIKQEQLHLQALDALATLTAFEEAAGALERAQQYARRQLVLEPWREAAYRQLMRLLARQGQRTAALAQYQSCRQVLSAELGVAPEAETTTLYEQIRSGEFDKGIRRQPLSGEDNKATSDRATSDRGPAHPAGDSLLPPHGTRAGAIPAPLVDWGEMPAVEFFAGRAAEVEQLQRWLTPGNPLGAGSGPPARLIALVGLGGMGKTTLAATVTKAVAPLYDIVIWRSLLNAPPLAELLHNWLQILSRGSLVALPTSLDEQLRRLLTYLRAARCLLVLDNVESILAAGDAANQAGETRPGYEGYGQLFQQVGSCEHTSCLLLTSREQPYALLRLARQAQSTSGRVRVLALTGLDLTASQVIIQRSGLAAPAPAVTQLVTNYSGNPLALQIVATTIADFFDGDIALFQQEAGFFFDGIRAVLDQQFTRLSALERELLVWLAIEREASTAPILRGNLLQTPSPAEVLGALHALQARSLLEKTGDGLTLQNVIIEYTTEYLVEQVCRELLDLEFWHVDDGSSTQAAKACAGTSQNLPSKIELSFLNRFALLKVQAKEYVQQSQTRLLLKPVAERLLTTLGKTGVMTHSQQILNRLRGAPRQPGYAAGNLLNLLRCLEIDLAGYDFSQLAVWQADLRGVMAVGLNFSAADLQRSAFTLTFDTVAIQIRPSGTLQVAGVVKSDVYLWQAHDGQLADEIYCPSHGGYPMIFSPDGQMLAAAGQDRQIRIWASETGELRQTLHEQESAISALAISPDGLYLASGTAESSVCLWDLRNGRIIQQLDGHEHGVGALAFSPDGSILASGDNGHRIRLWHTGTRGSAGQLLATREGHRREIGALAFSPTGDRLASGSHDGLIYLWDLNLAGEFNMLSGDWLTLSGHSGIIRALRFHPHPTHALLLASASSDRTVRLWSSTGELRHTLLGHSHEAEALAFSPDGQTLASSGADRKVCLWDTRTGHALNSLQAYCHRTPEARFSPDQTMIASGSTDEFIRLWAVTSPGAPMPAAAKQSLRYLHSPSPLISSVAFGPAGTSGAHLLASGSVDGTVQLWEMASGQLVHTLTGHQGSVRSVKFHPDGALLASAGSDGTIRLWPLAENLRRRTTQHRRLVGHQADITTVVFSSDGRLLGSSSLDGTARIWDVTSGAPVQVLAGHTNALSALAFNPDNRTVATSSFDHTVRLWDATSGECLRLWREGQIGERTVAFSPDGKWLAYSGSDLAIYLRDWRTWALVAKLSGHTNTILSLDFSPTAGAYHKGDEAAGEVALLVHRPQFGTHPPTAALLLSSSWDGTLRIWDLATKQCVQTLLDPGPYAGMKITGVTGISAAQKTALKALGAVEEDTSSQTQGQPGQPRGTALVASQSLSSAAIAHNLPAQLTPFVGRTRELTELLTRLRQPEQRLLTLIGPGGMGKTRLALEVAQRVLASKQSVGMAPNLPSALPNPQFADGIFFVSLAPLSSAAALTPAIAAAIGLDLHGPDPQQTLLSFLRPKQLLLILDNAEHLPEVAPLIATLVQGAPHLQIIVTSRARLNLHGESFYHVQPLPVSDSDGLAASDAVRLFAQRAPRSQPGFTLTASNLPAILRICRLVEGMPLGIEMAAAWSEWLSLAEIASEIEKSSDFLTADWLDAPSRQRTLRAVFEWSWKLLTDHEQRAFRALSIFRGGFTRQAAAQVVGASLHTLISLANKSLLYVTTHEEAPRYQIHELLRQFAAEQLDAQPDERATIAACHSAYYLTFIADRERRLARHEPRQAATEIQQELDNVRQAWLFAVKEANCTLLDKSVSGLARYYDTTGLLGESIQVLGQTAAMLEAGGPKPIVDTENSPSNQVLLSKLLAIQAAAMVKQGKFDEGMALAQKAATVGAAVGGIEGEVYGQMVVGQGLYRKGHYQEAHLHFTELLRLIARHQSQKDTLELLNDAEYTAHIWLGATKTETGDFAAAKTHFYESIHLCQTLNKVRSEVHARINLANLLRRMCDYTTARQIYEECLQIVRNLGYHWGEGEIQVELGDVVRMLGEYTLANDLYLRAEALLGKSGYNLEQMYSHTMLVHLHAHLGNYAYARQWLDRVLTAPLLHESAWLKVAGLLAHAIFAQLTGDHETARQAAQDALERSRLLHSPHFEANGLLLLAHAQLDLRQWETAAQTYHQACTLCDRLANEAVAAEARAGLALLASLRGEDAPALALVEELLPRLYGNHVIGLDEPFFVHLACYRILTACRDQRAAAVLANACNRLDQYATQIHDPTLRHSFLQNVPVHRALRQAYEHAQGPTT